MSEILVTCPWCKTAGFTMRGIRAHYCEKLGRKKLGENTLHVAITLAEARAEAAAKKSTPSPISMPKGNLSETSKSQLVVTTDSSLRVSAKADLAKLQAGVLIDIAKSEHLDHEVAARRILIGITLCRIKLSVGRGNFLPWIKKNIGASAYRNCNYAMQLGRIFLEKRKPLLPALLALPGDQLCMTVLNPEGEANPLRDALAKFVKDKSFYELLEEHELRGAKKTVKTSDDDGNDDKDGDNENAGAIDPEQLTAKAREDFSAWLETGRQLLIQENIAQHLPKPDLRAAVDSFDALGREWRKGVKKSLGDIEVDAS